jgi:hypothetical protein
MVKNKKLDKMLFKWDFPIINSCRPNIKIDFIAKYISSDSQLLHKIPAINAVMATDSGITSADLKAKIEDLLQATHVEIEDQSGTPPHRLPPPPSPS